MAWLKKRGLLAHFNRARSGDEIESGAAFGGSWKSSAGHPPYGAAAVLSGGKGRIVIAGLRGEDSIAELCRKEDINQNLYYRWSKDFQKLGQRLSILVARIHRDELTRVFKNDEIPLAVAIFGFARLADLWKEPRAQCLIFLEVAYPRHTSGDSQDLARAQAA
jgi:hypothetical protein